MDGLLPLCIIADMRLPGIGGFDLLLKLRDRNDDTPMILLASEPEVPLAVEAMRRGALDFVAKPYIDLAVLRQVEALLASGRSWEPCP